MGNGRWAAKTFSMASPSAQRPIDGGLLLALRFEKCYRIFLSFLSPFQFFMVGQTLSAGGRPTVAPARKNRETP
jgi:hypothetical protein